jgi:hypothetical protein
VTQGVGPEFKPQYCLKKKGRKKCSFLGFPFFSGTVLSTHFLRENQLKKVFKKLVGIKTKPLNSYKVDQMKQDLT